MAGEQVSQEEVLAQLRTRGFESGGERTPLRDFWGKLGSITGEMRQGQRGAYLVSLYNFSELEVIYTVEPYTDPIAQIEISASTRQKSRAGYFGASVDKIINANVPPDVPALIPDPNGGVDAAGNAMMIPNPMVKNQSYLLGKVLHMKMTPGHPVWNQTAGAEQPIDCWELVEIRGEGTPAPAMATPAAAPQVATPQPAPQPAPGAPVQNIAMDLMDGQTLSQWHSIVFSRTDISQEVKNAIINNQFVPPLEAAGLVTKDANGVYHVVR